MLWRVRLYPRSFGSALGGLTSRTAGRCCPKWIGFSLQGTDRLELALMWPLDQAWRAPVGDFPPSWASAWGDDLFGLWADLTVNGATQRMRWIEPSGPDGFLMGSTQKERNAIRDSDFLNWSDKHESAPTKVLIAQGFWMADTPCTQNFWLAVMGQNPSQFKNQPDAAMRPVEQDNWVEIEKFVLRFAATPEWGCADRLSLPTESQWEYAARAGSSTAYWWGNEVNSAMANWNGEQGGTTPVKRYSANPWGLFDMHGNVWECCQSPWTQLLDDRLVRPDPDALAVRGGSWVDEPGLARSAFRFWMPRDGLDHFLGFRFALRTSSHQAAKPQQEGVPGGPSR
jgi:sulfatase modifying factor 1